ncbi:glycosyltransferase family 2 protein [Jejuia spongiicola]|uniref:Glycosyltransferase n=1 Tax=Jejuia spongiicola TaxID=2942207 RepID=A0ABT0QD61_9FLAO|nr:glycosyltransferase [Jejuia spongiicola]MCL6294927.1 glycosyltransferase [Jejuia spongiicola]
MKLSIIIPVYNVEKHIARCIQSLLSQGLNAIEYEIIIVNDGSKDNSVEIAKGFQSKHSNVFVFNKENSGVGSARNFGLDVAKGTYIYFIDPDDYLANNTLKLILDCIEINDLEVLTFLSKGTENTNLYDSTTNISENLSISKISGTNYIGNNGYKNEVWWYIIKKEHLNKIGLRFIEGRWMEDAIFTANLLINTSKAAHLPIDAHRHVKVKGSAMTSKEPSHYLKVIYDNANAALMYKPLIESIKRNEENEACLERLKARQQSFVFFLMIRILKSTIKLKEVKKIIKNMNKINAYPLNSFLGNDYNGFIYTLLVKLFNIKSVYYFLFLVSNPLLKLKK